MIVWGSDAAVLRTISHQLQAADFGPSIYAALIEQNKICGFVVYNMFMQSAQGIPISIEASVLILDRQCCNRYNFMALFSYPFIHLRVKRLQATVSRKNKKSRRLLERLGFRLEGIGREAWQRGGDSAFYSMLASECRFLNAKRTFGTDPSRSSRHECGANPIQ